MNEVTASILGVVTYFLVGFLASAITYRIFSPVKSYSDEEIRFNFSMAAFFLWPLSIFIIIVAPLVFIWGLIVGENKDESY